MVLAAACNGAPTVGTEAKTPRAARIVSLTPNVTEMIFAIGCGDRVVAVDSNSDFPPAVEGLPDVGGMHPSLERILAAHPDVVVGSSIGPYEGIATQLEARGIRYHRVAADRLRDIPAALEHLRSTLDCSGGVNLIEQIRSMTGDVSGGGLRVLVVATVDPLYVAGRETFLDDVLTASGAINALPDDVVGWPAYSIESVIARQPDVILVLSSPERWPQTKRLIESSTGWSGLRAVKEGRVAMLDESIATRPGPRVLETQELMRATLQRMDRP